MMRQALATSSFSSSISATRHGEGKTTCLRKPYSIVLKAGSWTDFCLPFQFDVTLKDILEATGPVSDSLDFYHWVQDNATYKADPMRIAMIDMRKPVLDTLISQQKYDGYTVYNNNSLDVVLQIPPVSLSLSNDHSITRSQPANNNDMWDIHFLWKEKGKHNLFRETVCAYNKHCNEPVLFGSYPPGMGQTRVGILDSVNNSIHGYAIQNNSENGGLYFKLAFQNSSDVPVTVEYSLAKSGLLPKGYEAKVLNCDERVYETYDDSVPAEISVPPGSVPERLVVIGTSEYLNDVLRWISPASFAFLKAYPNPFNGVIKLHYTLPPDIAEVRITLYNVLGKKLWQSIQQKGIGPGQRTFTLNTRRDLGTDRSLPAGIYILRLSAKNKAGKLILGGDKRIICVK